MVSITTTVTASLSFFVSAISNPIFSQESDEIYEGLGIKIKYFDPWTILTSSDDTNCYTKDFCMLTLGNR